MATRGSLEHLRQTAEKVVAADDLEISRVWEDLRWEFHLCAGPGLALVSEEFCEEFWGPEPSTPLGCRREAQLLVEYCEGRWPPGQVTPWHTLKHWSNVFDRAPDTISRWYRKGTRRIEKEPGGRRFRFHVDELP
jgi:hypothetical protein